MLGTGMPEASYHRRQAETLVRLAQSTTDQATARQLMLLAAEHTAFADANASVSEETDIEGPLVADSPTARQQKTREQLRELLMDQCAAVGLPVINVIVRRIAECDWTATPMAPRRKLAEIQGHFGAIVTDLRARYALRQE